MNDPMSPPGVAATNPVPVAPHVAGRHAPLALIIALTILGIAVAAALLAGFAPYDPTAVDLSARLQPPGATHLLGADLLGRDVWSRLLYGTRISLAVAALAILIGGLVGMLLGALAGYKGGRVDALIMRLTDVTLGFPLLVLAIFFAAIYGPSFKDVILVISLILWAPFARLARGETLVLKGREFITAARAEGASDLFIVRRHVLPHLLSSAMVLASLQGAAAILIEAALSFFGAGVPPPTPSWGGMINAGREYAITGWWIAFFPGLAITIIVLTLNILGDTLRDTLDPRMRRGR